jgi:hypothetical protein
MFENTRNMTADRLKATLKARAREEGADCRYTIWSENGIWSEGAAHVLFEGAALSAPEAERKARESSEKSGYSRTFIWDAVEDRIEIFPPRGAATVFGPPK